MHAARTPIFDSLITYYSDGFKAGSCLHFVGMLALLDRAFFPDVSTHTMAVNSQTKVLRARGILSSQDERLPINFEEVDVRSWSKNPDSYQVVGRSRDSATSVT